MVFLIFIISLERLAYKDTLPSQKCLEKNMLIPICEMEEYLSNQHMLPVLICNQTPYRLNVNRESYVKI